MKKAEISLFLIQNSFVFFVTFVDNSSMRGFKTFIRFAVSGVLVAILLYVAHRQHVWEKLRSVPPSCVLAGMGLLAIGWLINSQRWGLLLSAAGVRENPVYLASMYFIGMFFSMILPTGAGGDAARMWDVSRRHGAPAAAIVATLQERFLGLGMSMLVGVAAATIHYQRLPYAVRFPLLCLSTRAAAAAAFFLYPRVPISLATTIWRRIDPAGPLPLPAKVKHAVHR